MLHDEAARPRLPPHPCMYPLHTNPGPPTARTGDSRARALAGGRCLLSSTRRRSEHDQRRRASLSASLGELKPAPHVGMYLRTRAHDRNRSALHWISQVDMALWHQLLVQGDHGRPIQTIIIDYVASACTARCRDRRRKSPAAVPGVSRLAP